MNPTNEQQTIINATGSFRIMAGAGSGKTTTLTHFLRANLNKGLSPKQVAFMTFTRLAAQDIKAKMNSLIPGVKICCGTFHKVMLVDFMAAAGLVLPSPVNLYDGCMNRHVEFVLQQMRDGHPRLVTFLRTFRILIVDEFQDLDVQQFEFVSLFRRIQPELNIIAIGDLAQNIYSFRGTSNEFLRRLLTDLVPDLQTFYLRTNFRSSAAILAAVNAVFAPEIANGHVQPMLYGGAAQGPRPHYYEAQGSVGGGDYELAVVNIIAPKIQAAKEAGKSVALILPITRCQSYETIVALLSSRLPQIDFHKIAKEDTTSAVVEITYDNHDRRAPVQLSTFHASKGLEWDSVMLINVNDDVYRLRENDVEDEGFYVERTNLLYVAMTRAREELCIFGQGLRHRLLARIDLATVMDVTLWGEPEKYSNTVVKPTPVSVTRLIRTAGTHKDLYARLEACSKHIGSSFHRGAPIKCDQVYTEMKRRNREMEFGTFIDWAIKQQLSESPTLQDRLLELLYYMSANNWLHKDNGRASYEVVSAVLNNFFETAGSYPMSDITTYITPARIIATFHSKKYRMVPELKLLYSQAEQRIKTTYRKNVDIDGNLRDLYLLSHTLNLYAHGQLNPLRAVDAPVNSYMGLPAGFDEFAVASVTPAAAIIRAAVGAGEFRADVPVESTSLIYGETDLVTADGSGIVEIKCSAEIMPPGLRGSGNCENLLQLLSYVALGRHGVTKLDPRWAILVNPLTATWERYDLSTWTMEQSAAFLSCLEELRLRL